MDCNTPGFTVHHQLPELAQTHVHRVGDVIQSSHPLSSPSPSAFNLSQRQGLSNVSVLCISWPKDWSFSFQHQSFCWGKHTDRNRPPWPDTIVTICMNCFMTGDPDKEYGTNKPPLTRRVPGKVERKAMAPHSSTLAWKISWTEEPGRLQSMGSLRVGHD